MRARHHLAVSEPADDAVSAPVMRSLIGAEYAAQSDDFGDETLS